MKAMRKLLLLLVCMMGFIANAQVDGLSYQGVIVNPEAQELPGQNNTGNFLSRTDVQVRFTIVDATGNEIYKETHETRTDRFGMFSLRIGEGTVISANEFTAIQWDGTPKNLKVEVAIDGSFKTLDTKELTFIPYAFHRDIFASGNMEVNGLVSLGDNLLVRGTTNLNDSLSVNNGTRTDLTGTLTVDDATLLNNSLSVNNQRATSLSGSLTVFGESQLNKRMTVEGATRFEDILDVDGASKLNRTLVVEGETTMDDNLTVIESNNTLLTGTLTVDGETNFNSTVNINNGSTLSLSGNLDVAEDVVLNGNLVVNRFTNLNKTLSVNNGEFTSLSGKLFVDGKTTLQDSLFVTGVTNLENVLRVNNEMPVYLSGTLDVDLATTLNSALNVNNGSDTQLTGPLTVQGMIDFGADLTVQGRTNLNGDLFVNNAALTDMSGPLRTDGSTMLAQTLVVDGATILNNDLTVANTSPTLFTGTLRVDGATTLNNTLDVVNLSATQLTGALGVDGITTLNNTLEVTNGAATALSGVLDVTQETLFNNTWNVGNAGQTNLTGLLNVTEFATLNTLNVANATPTQFTGTLGVTGATTLNSALTVNGFTQINDDLTVTGLADLQNLVAKNFNVSDDQAGEVALFSSTNETDSQGMLIKLGKTHPRFLGGVFIGANQVSNGGSPSPGVIQTIKDKFQAGVPTVITPGEMAVLIPDLISLGALPDINNFVFQEINARFQNVSFPGMDFANFNFPGIPGFPDTPELGVIFPGIQFYGGFGGGCSGQACVSVCVPLLGCATVCVPPVNICLPAIPAIGFPEIRLNGFNLTPRIPNLIPDLPFLSTPSLTDVNFPTLPDEIVFDALTNENQYAVFQDVDGRVLGSIRAESIQDFFARTLDNDVYMVNVLSEFVGIDLAKVKSKVGFRMVKIVVEYNQSGLEYSTGNGDYAEWLERQDTTEYLSAGDIVGVKGGKISRDLTDAEQLMVVSLRPAVMGNAPDEADAHKGNAVAFIGQIPVKVIGPVNSGDYIVPHDRLVGYGQAVSPKEMTVSQFGIAVGRSWITNLTEGPKMVNTVVGLQNGDWKRAIESIDTKQSKLNNGLDALEARLKAIDNKLSATVN